MTKMWKNSWKYNKKENKSWVDAKIYIAYAIIKKNELGKLKTQRTLFQDQKKSF